MFGSILSAVLKLLGLADWAKQVMHDRDQRRIGRMEQRSADLQAALKVSKDQAEAAANAPKTRDELREVLRKGEL